MRAAATLRSLQACGTCTARPQGHVTARYGSQPARPQGRVTAWYGSRNGRTA